METTLEKVLARLQKRNIHVNTESIQKHQYQGFMSTVYTVDSNVGKVLIQVSDLVEEHRRNKVWKKFEGLASILDSHPEIPTSRLLFCGLIEDRSVIVQTFLEGERAGQRTLQDSKIVDEWFVSEKYTLPNVLRALGAIHAITLDSFGWQAINTGEKSIYKTWKEFIEKESSDWVSTIIDTDKGLREKLQSFVKKTTSRIEYSGPAVLVHGDAINPSNILVFGKSVYLVDWEWAIGADPAWEFCDIGWEPYRTKNNLTPYFEERRIAEEQQSEFLKRVDLYAPLWLLWGTYMHAKDENRQIYLALKEMLVSNIG